MRKIIFLVFFVIGVNTVFAQTEELSVENCIDSTKLYWKNNNKRAMYFANLSLQKVDTSNYDKYATCLKNKGIVFYFAFDTDSAEYYYLQSIRIFKKANIQNGINKIYNNLGVLKMELGEYDKALEYYNKSYEIAINISDTAAIIRSLVNISNIYSEIKKFSTALENNLKALNYIKSIYDPSLEANIYASIFAIYRELGDFKNFEKYNSLALKAYTKLKDEIGLAICYTNIANGYEHFNNLVKALELNKKALDIFEEKEYIRGLVHVQLILGNNYRNLQQFTKSTKHFKSGLQKALSYKMQTYQKDFYRELYINHLFIADLNLSRLYQIKADSIERIILSETIQDKIADMETKYKTLEKEMEIKQLTSEKIQQELTIKTEKRNKQLIFIFSVLVTVIGASSTVLYRLRQKQKRTSLYKTKAELENRLLRVQMNPHFIFNSLNSVQSYISSNQNDLAEDYLARFALLTRYILNNSREDFVLFSNEIETLSIYLELEQQRFNHQFDFEISIDDFIDEETIKAPPMLTQPFAENAILHGLAPKKGKGKISISFNPYKNSEQIIECTIIDNGIGREAATKVQKGSKHKSLGLQLTSERLQLIESQTGFETRFETIDLFDENKIAAGTMVKIIFPCKKLY